MIKSNKKMFSDKAVEKLNKLISKISENNYNFSEILPFDISDEKNGFALYAFSRYERVTKNLVFHIYPDGEVKYALFGPIDSMLHEKDIDLDNEPINELFKKTAK